MKAIAAAWGWLAGYKTYVVMAVLEAFLCHGMWVGKFDVNTWILGSGFILGFAGLKSGQATAAAQILQKQDKIEAKVSDIHDNTTTNKGDGR